MKDLVAEYAMRNIKKEDVVHSTGYAVSASGEVLGVASTQSFEARRKIDADRKNIRKYNDSRLVAQATANAPRAKQYAAPEGATGALKTHRTMPLKKPGISR